MPTRCNAQLVLTGTALVVWVPLLLKPAVCGLWFQVRLALVSAPLHEIAALLGRERCMQYLQPCLSSLLSDDSRDVRAAAAAQLVTLLEQVRVHWVECCCQLSLAPDVPTVQRQFACACV